MSQGEGNTLLLAAQAGQAEVVRSLLHAGAGVDTPRPSDGATPLLMAAQQGHAEVVQLLLGAGAVVNRAPTCTRRPGSSIWMAPRRCGWRRKQGTQRWCSYCSAPPPSSRIRPIGALRVACTATSVGR
jgi:ankyrin repeat protein